jgi:glucose uptake protein
MILPHTYAAALALTILTMFCWGSWTNVMKLTKNWRFELLYYDYSLGIFLGSLVAGLTFGAMGGDGLRFADDLAQAGTGNILYGFIGGVIFNLSNFLVVGAISVAGMGVGFPVGVGLALVVGVIWNYIVNPQGNATLLFTGVGLIVAAMIIDGIAYRAHSISKAAAGQKSDAEAKRSVKKGIILAITGGILMGMFFPLVELGKQGENGLGPYGIGFIFSVGVFLSTFVFNLYFMRFPVDGPPLRFKDYVRGCTSAHLWGILGGVIWITGSLSNFVAASAPRELQVGPAISYALGQGSTMVGAAWGVLVWKEFAGGGRRIQLLLVLMFIFFLAGLGVVSIAPLMAPR